MSFLTLLKKKAQIADTSLSRNDESLFFNKSVEVLTTGFPNPDRVGCPDRSTLESIASHKIRLNEIGPWLKHLSACSECFRDVRELRGQRQVQSTVKWSIAGAAAIVVVAVLIAWSNGKLRHRDQATLDLRNAAISRGIENQPNANPGTLPILSRSSRKVSVYLPPGRQGAVELRVIDDSGAVVATTTGIGKAVDSSTVIQIKIELSKAAPGTYSLLLKQGATSTIYRIQLE